MRYDERAKIESYIEIRRRSGHIKNIPHYIYCPNCGDYLGKREDPSDKRCSDACVDAVAKEIGLWPIKQCYHCRRWDYVSEMVPFLGMWICYGCDRVHIQRNKIRQSPTKTKKRRRAFPMRTIFRSIPIDGKRLIVRDVIRDGHVSQLRNKVRSAKDEKDLNSIASWLKKNRYRFSIVEIRESKPFRTLPY